MEQNEKQLRYLSTVFNNLGTVFAASMIVPLIGSGNSFYDLSRIIVGMVFASGCWWFGYYLLKEV